MWRWLQRHFLTGLLAVTPLALTAWVLVKSYELINVTMRPWLQRIPRLTETYPDQLLTVIAFLSFLLLIVLVGLATRSLVGVAFFNVVERALARIPVVKTIFVATKQIASGVPVRQAVGLPAGGAVRVPAPGLLQPRLRHPRRARQRTCSTSSCRPRPTPPAATCCWCRASRR